MEKIILKKIDEVYVQAITDSSIKMELSEFFKFKVPGYQFMPAYRNKFWSGDIYLFNRNTSLIYAGLAEYIDRFAKDREYLIEYDYEFGDNEFSLKEANEFVEKLKPTMKPRDYQMKAFVDGVRKDRTLFLSPTASGKSFIIYLLSMYHFKKTLIVVPTTTLVYQMASDFKDYGFPADKHIHKIYSGQDKKTDKQIVITTWQSIYKQPKKWFEQFEVIIGDEAHLFKAKSLTSIMEKTPHIKHRYGFTGTLDGSQTHKLVLEGLFGPVLKVTTTKELIDKKQLSDFEIKCIILKHSEADRRKVKSGTYQDEMDFIVRNEDRNRFLKNLVLSLEGNSLLLFQYVDKHGKVLYDIIKQERDNVYFVHGGVEGSERDEIRHIVDEQKDAIIVASYGTFSTGINIKNINNIIFASPSKSRIRNLQSIGRGLRLGNNEELSHLKTTLYDIADDLIWKSKKNHTILHFAERLKTYSEEKFEYKIYNVRLK